MTSPGLSDAALRWRAIIEPRLTERAVAVATAVAAALSDPGKVASAADSVTSGPSVVRELPWRPASLAGGHTGIALAAAYFESCRPGEGWAQVGHAHLAAATRNIAELRRLDASISGGWGGLVCAAHVLANGRQRYEKLLKSADEALAAGALRMAAQVNEFAVPIPPPLVDVISGLSGMAGVLLLRKANPRCREALHACLSSLVGLTRSIGGIPRVAAPADWGVFGLRRGGAGMVLNLGFAHGIPGIIAALALALLENEAVEGQELALTSFVSTLLEYRLDDDWGAVWPAMTPIGAGRRENLRATRTAWCYGGPGCARALWLAGEALSSSSWKNMALAAIRASLRRPNEKRVLPSPTFCHGRAGLVFIGLRFAVESDDAGLCALLQPLLAELLGEYEETRRFGYSRLDSQGVRRDDPGLLDGAAGVAAVLLAASSDVEPKWDRAFMLA